MRLRLYLDGKPYVFKSKRKKGFSALNICFAPNIDGSADKEYVLINIIKASEIVKRYIEKGEVAIAIQARHSKFKTSRNRRKPGYRSRHTVGDYWKTILPITNDLDVVDTRHYADPMLILTNQTDKHTLKGRCFLINIQNLYEDDMYLYIQDGPLSHNYGITSKITTVDVEDNLWYLDLRATFINIKTGRIFPTLCETITIEPNWQ